MISHYIIMSSSYSRGERIALHYIMDDESKYPELRAVVPQIMEECGNDVSISTHCIDTDLKTWESIVEHDHYFKDVHVISDLKEFINLINIDRELEGIDVAKYILSKVECTYIKLERLVYICYAEYLSEYGKELYKDTINTDKYGLIAKSIYEIYKKHEITENCIIDTVNIQEMPSQSRITFAREGVQKLYSIKKTLKKYGNLSEKDLIKIKL